MRGILHMLVSVACYGAAVVGLVYLIGFVAACPALPAHVDKGLDAPLGTALAIDVALIALFAIQHSIMARPGFKAGWTRIVPPPVERAAYCLATALVLLALFAFWHPIGGTVWSVENPALRAAIPIVNRKSPMTITGFTLSSRLKSSASCMRSSFSENTGLPSAKFRMKRSPLTVSRRNRAPPKAWGMERTREEHASVTSHPASRAISPSASGRARWARVTSCPTKRMRSRTGSAFVTMQQAN